ncbi:MAG: metallophosphoesterase family protein, partial [Brucella pseudogrignonensis]
MSFKRFAVIADIHGNSDALAAVLADIDALNVQTIVNLGDHLSGPLAARETADMLMAREMIAIRGNHDRWLVEKAVEDMGPSDRVAYDQLEERHLAW